MTDRDLMQQALEALTTYDGTNGESKRKRVLAALRERLARPEMQPCAGRNCGSTNPNLHSAECFEDYEKSTGMNQWQGLTDGEIDILSCETVKGNKSVNWLCKVLEAKLKEKNA